MQSGRNLLTRGVAIEEDGVYLFLQRNGTPLLFIHPPGMGHIVFRHPQS
ncbi:hypothetical protein B4168_2225 [Anoxybacillus flavithermus]|nr:hypothetical protein B4168_2225 [Anoxybacillus flavithermus]OAO85880.1 hydrolase [Parageobacillus thermoglucosidasius]